MVSMCLAHVSQTSNCWNPYTHMKSHQWWRQFFNGTEKIISVCILSKNVMYNNQALPLTYEEQRQESKTENLTNWQPSSYSN